MRRLSLLFALLALAGAVLPTSHHGGDAEAAHERPAVIGRIQLPGDGATGLGINPDTDRLYVATTERGMPASTVVLDLNSLQILAVIPAAGAPWGIGVDRSSNTIYTNDAFDGRPYVIDGSRNEVIVKIEPTQSPPGVANGWPGGLAVDELRDKVYIADIHLSRIGILPVGEDTITKNIEFPEIDNGINDVAVDSARGRVYAASFTFYEQEAAVQVVDADSDARIATIPLPGQGRAVEVDETTGAVWVTSPNRNSVFVLDGPGESFVTEIAVGVSPFGIALVPSANRAYITNQGGGSVSVVDTASHAVIGSVDVGREPLGVVADPERDRVYVAGFRPGPAEVVVIGEAEDVLPAVEPGADLLPPGGGPPAADSQSHWLILGGAAALLLASYIAYRLAAGTKSLP